MLYPRSLNQLIGQLERLPGVGPKLAQRLALYLLRRPEEESESLASALLMARARTHFCENCFFLSEEPVCEICRDNSRDTSLLCVVADPRDVLAIERIGSFRGYYHVLQGLISPADNIYPEQLKINALMQRLEQNPPQEIILATSPTVEGDTTALYIARLLKPTGIKITRLAHGMPVGGDLDYTDAATLLSALEWRREL